jgi:hypothetical protein
VVRHGASRRQIARKLNSAYACGLLSQETYMIRIEHLLGRRLVDPVALTGDLTLRTRHAWRRWLSEAKTLLRRGDRELLLSLEWGGEQPELVIGRHYDCDVVLTDPSVSRRHARIVFRDGSWILQDLASTNGTKVNGAGVGRCVIRPGDHLALGTERLRVD